MSYTDAWDHGCPIDVIVNPFGIADIVMSNLLNRRLLEVKSG